MMGRNDCEDGEFANEDRGLQPRCLEYLFQRLDQIRSQAGGRVEFSVKCTYVEIYNEQFFDLVNYSFIIQLGGGISQGLTVREDAKKGIYLEGVREEVSRSLKQTLEIMQKGAKQRHIGATQMNLESSRSHSVFSVSVESKTEVRGIWKLRRSMFHFVDLAGSERQKKTEAQGERLKEGCNINKSLSVLGSVINALVDTTNGKKVHVRYRDSKLTFLLRDSLGGNSRTAIIANVSPASVAFHETLSTLQFAQRAKLIKNKARLNEDTAGDAEALKIEIRRLKEELESAKLLIDSGDFMRNENVITHKPGQIVLQKDVIAAETSRALELEELFQDLTQQMIQNQQFLEVERLQKEAQLNKFQQTLAAAEEQELHLKTIIKLLEFKTSCNLEQLKSSKAISDANPTAVSSTDQTSKFGSTVFAADTLQSTLSRLEGSALDCSMSLLPEGNSKAVEDCSHLELLEIVNSLQNERDAFRNMVHNCMPPVAQIYRENLVLSARVADLEPLAPKPADPRQTMGLLQRLLKCLESSTSDRQHLLQALAQDKDPLAHSRLGSEVQSLREENTVLRETLLNMDVQRREAECSYRETLVQLEEKDRGLALQRSVWETDVQVLKQRLEEVSAQLLQKEKQTCQLADPIQNMIPEQLAVSVASAHEQKIQAWDQNDKLVELNRQKAFLEEEVKNLKEMLQVEKSLLAEERNATSKLISTEVALREQLNTLQSQNDVLMKEMEGLRHPEEWTPQNGQMLEEGKELDAFPPDSKNLTGRTEADLIEQIEALKNELSQSEEARDTLAQSLEFFQEEFARQKAKREKQIAALETKINSMSSLESHPDYVQLKTDYESTSQRLQDKTAREKSLLESYAALQEMLTLAQLNYSNTVNSLTVAEQENRELQSMYSELKDELVDSKEECLRQAVELEQLKKQLAKIRTEDDLRQQEAAKLLAQHVELKTAVIVAQNRMKELSEKNQTLTAELQEASELAEKLLQERNQYLRLANTLQNGMTEVRVLLDTNHKSKDEVVFWDEITKSVIRKEEVAILNHQLSQKDAKIAELATKVLDLEEGFKFETAQLGNKLASLENQLTREQVSGFQNLVNRHRRLMVDSQKKRQVLEEFPLTSNCKENCNPVVGVGDREGRSLMGQRHLLGTNSSRKYLLGDKDLGGLALPEPKRLFRPNTPRKSEFGIPEDHFVAGNPPAAKLWKLFENLCTQDEELKDRFWASAKANEEMVENITSRSPTQLAQQMQQVLEKGHSRLGKRAVSNSDDEDLGWPSLEADSEAQQPYNSRYVGRSEKIAEQSCTGANSDGE